MRLTTVLCATALLTSFAAAQAPASNSWLNIYPDLWGFDSATNQGAAQSTSFTDRGISNPTGNEVEILQELPKGMLSHVGAIGVGACEMTEFMMMIQDENLATQETMTLVVRPIDPVSGVGPDMNAANVIYTAGLGSLPALNGPGAFNAWWTFQNPVPLPCTSDYFFGAKLPQSTGWAQQFSDGLSVHMAEYTLGNLGDNPRASAPPIGWSVDMTTMTPQSHTQVWDMAIGTATPTLQAGSDDPIAARYNVGTTGFGAAGMYPDVSGPLGTGREDGISLRIHDNANVGGMAFALLSIGFGPAPIPITGFGGVMPLNPAILLSAGQAPIALDPSTSQSVAVITVLSPKITPPSVVGTMVYFIGVSTGPAFSNPWFTNVAGVSF